MVDARETAPAAVDAEGLPRRERRARSRPLAQRSAVGGDSGRAGRPGLDRAALRQAAAGEIAGAGDPHRARRFQARCALPRRALPDARRCIARYPARRRCISSTARCRSRAGRSRRRTSPACSKRSRRTATTVSTAARSAQALVDGVRAAGGTLDAGRSRRLQGQGARADRASTTAAGTSSPRRRRRRAASRSPKCCNILVGLRPAEARPRASRAPHRRGDASRVSRPRRIPRRSRFREDADRAS